MITSKQNNKKEDAFNFIALQAAPRVLSLLDRNPFSESFGCFDKQYWHFKTKDFPSASFQMGVEYLARLWEFPQKPYFKNSKLLQWIKASMDYTVKIQHKDGSFDEWYPNERGWAGPTSYVINALAAAYTITEECLEDKLKNSLQNSFYKAAEFLLQRDEGDVLSNHFALFLLSLHRVHQITGDQKLKTQLERHLKKFFSHTSKEGWSLEYNGADFSYELATLGFLGRIHEQFPHSLLKGYAEKSFQFLSYFFYPDGSFGGGIGSRETVHLYPYAIKYWSQTIPVARAVFHHLTEQRSFQKLSPLDQDDHYLFYRLSEYLECDSIKIKSTEWTEKESDFQSEDKPVDKSVDNFLPFKRQELFQKYFPESGLFVKKEKTFYFVSNLKKGGCLQMYNIPQRTCLLKNYGWIAKFKNQKMATAFWLSNNSPKIKIARNEIFVSGKISVFHQKYFTPLRLILFRLITISFGWNAKGAFYLKRLIRKVLITNSFTFFQNFSVFFQRFSHNFQKKKGYNEKEISFNLNHSKRWISFDKEKVEVIDCLFPKKVERIFYGGGFSLRYVPQSNYFQACDLIQESKTFVFKGPFEKKPLFIRQICYLKDFSIKVELCAESPDTFNSKEIVPFQ